MSTRILHVVSPAILLCFSSLFAQSEKTAQPRAEKPSNTMESRLDQQADEMRRQMVEGKPFRSHVRVTTRLKNGNTIRGVVKDGLVVERLDGLRFVAAEEGQPGAGIRIYYWNGGSSYVFLPFEEVRECKINERLTPAQLRVIELENKQRDAASERDRQQVITAANPSTTDSTGPLAAPAGEIVAPQGQGQKPQNATNSTAAQGGLSKDQQELFALVQDYPPLSGWCQQKRDEISRRMAVIGSRPSNAELRFVAKFLDWQKACELFHLQPAVTDQPAPAGEVERGRRGRSNF